MNEPFFCYEWRHSACGTKTRHIQGIGLNAIGELLVFYTCSKCKMNVCARMPLEQIIADVPAGKPHELTAEDIKYLAEMHISADRDATP